MDINESLKVAFEKFQEQARMHGFGQLLLPPPVSIEMGTEFTEYEPQKRIVAKIPFNEKYSNPVGFFQGGMIAAAFDNAYGPLCYDVAQQPCVTIEMSVQYLRPFTQKDAWLFVEAEAVHKTKQLLFLKATAYVGENKKLVATSTTTLMLIEPRKV